MPGSQLVRSLVCSIKTRRRSSTVSPINLSDKTEKSFFILPLLCEDVLLHRVFSFLSTTEILRLECVNSFFQGLVFSKLREMLLSGELYCSALAEEEKSLLNLSNQQWQPSFDEEFFRFRLKQAVTQNINFNVLLQLFGEVNPSAIVENMLLQPHMPDEQFEKVKFLHLLRSVNSAGLVLSQRITDSAESKPLGTHILCHFLERDSTTNVVTSNPGCVKFYFQCHPDRICESSPQSDKTAACSRTGSASKRLIRAMSYFEIYPIFLPSFSMYTSDDASYVEMRALTAHHETRLWELSQLLELEHPHLLDFFRDLALPKIETKRKFFVAYRLPSQSLSMPTLPKHDCTKRRSHVIQKSRMFQKISAKISKYSSPACRQPKDTVYPRWRWFRLSSCTLCEEIKHLRLPIVTSMAINLFNAHQLYGSHKNLSSENVLVGVPSLKHLTEISDEEKAYYYERLASPSFVEVVFEDPLSTPDTKICGLDERGVLFQMWAFWDGVNDDGTQPWELRELDQFCGHFEDLFALFFIICQLFNVNLPFFNHDSVRALVDMSSNVDYYKTFILPLEFSRQRNKLPLGVYQILTLIAYLIIDLNDFSTMVDTKKRRRLLLYRWRSPSWDLLRQRLMHMLFRTEELGEKGLESDRLCKLLCFADPKFE